MPACNTFVFIYQCDVAILDAGSDWTWIDRLGIERDYCSVCIWRHFSECYVNNGSRRDFVWLPISWVLLQIPQPKRFFSRENFVYFENCNLLLLLRFDEFFFQFTIFPKIPYFQWFFYDSMISRDFFKSVNSIFHSVWIFFVQSCFFNSVCHLFNNAMIFQMISQISRAVANLPTHFVSAMNALDQLSQRITP